MRRIIYHTTLVLLFLSCNISKKEEFSIILNDNFLSITDTVAYSYGSFFITPGEENSPPNKKNELKISVCGNIENSTLLIKYLQNELAQSEQRGFLDLLNKKNDSVNNIGVLDLSHITKKGRYELVNNKNCSKNDSSDSSFVGSLQFYEPLIEENIAILFASLQSSPKAGVINAYLVKKDVTKWKIVRKIELERW